MSTNHTPGPWRVGVERSGEVYNPSIVYGGEEQGICQLSRVALNAPLKTVLKDELSAEGLANAYLIAAAPELLEALKMAHWELNLIRARCGVPYDDHGIKASVTEEYFSSVVEKAAEAIAKAEGKQ